MILKRVSMCSIYVYEKKEKKSALNFLIYNYKNLSVHLTVRITERAMNIYDSQFESSGNDSNGEFPP